MFNKSLCIFDVESTGLSPSNDRIVQLGIKIISPVGKVLLNKSKLYNPGIPISEAAYKTHGISNESVKNEIPFKQDASKLKKIFENKIIAGYNILRFDLPLLAAEFERCGISIDFGTDIIDVLKIERKINDNTLSSVYKRYTGKELDGSHDASNDLNATFEILQHQINNFDLDEDKLYELSGSKDMLDYSGKLSRDAEGFLIFNFGKKCMGKRVIDNKDYASWVLSEELDRKSVV